MRYLTLLITLALAASSGWSQGTSASLDPKIRELVPGVKLELIAEHPTVMTPTGIDVDAEGGVWFVCCHTHFRPDDYEGPEHDEVVRLVDGKRVVFYAATDATMDLELGPDGWVYLTERDRLLRVKDTDGDGRGDREETIATLETEGDYPHNGLSAMAWQTNGDLVFSLGENHWNQWTLKAAGGAAIRGTGEGGVFRCKPDGRGMKRIAKGFWNPFGLAVSPNGELFACENDPGSRPPCRLLHIVPGGDYGYQRLYGKTPHHPFVCWNGELRDTLPMLYSVGEAPCGIAWFKGGLIVTSWTDHRIDFYPLSPSGASFQTKRIPLVSGSLDFRPTCIAAGPEGSFYLTDWVVGSYNVHRKGRVWRMVVDSSKATFASSDATGRDKPNRTRAALLASQLRQSASGFSLNEIYQHARSEDSFVSSAAISALASRLDSPDAASILKRSVEDQINALLALKRGQPQNANIARVFLDQNDERLRFEALRWICDSNMTEFLPQIETILDDPNLDFTLFEACLATRNTLKGEPRSGVVDEPYLLQVAANEQTPDQTRAFALRMLDPNRGRLHKTFSSLSTTVSGELRAELVRSVAASNWDGAQKFLLSTINQPGAESNVQADAIAGLVPSEKAFATLVGLLGSNEPSIRLESARKLRQFDLNERQRAEIRIQIQHLKASEETLATFELGDQKQSRPPSTDTQAWQQRLANIKQPADVDAGRRVFFGVGRCSNCHRHSGRGNVVGPDLSATAASDGQHVLQAILRPSKDVDPQYFARTLVFEDGTSFTGIMLRDGGGGREFYRDNEGKERAFVTKDIVARKELRTSVMPDGLIDLITDRELRDLLAFLLQADR